MTKAELQRENDYLRALVDERFKDAAKLYLQHAGPDGKGGFVFELRAGIIPLVAEFLAAQFKAMGGENYVQIEICHTDLGPLELTLQRRWGEMAGAKAARLEAENARLLKLVESRNIS